MDISAVSAFRAGEHVELVDDKWTSIGRDIVLVAVEPVPGSTQCVIEADGEPRVVSRANLRHLEERA